MKIDFEDRAWQIELLDVDMPQGETIGAYTGLSILGWYKSLLDTDSLTWARSVRCLYWLMWQQNPQHGATPPLETLNFRPLQLFAAFNAAMEAENSPARAAEEDPTRPAGTSAAASPGPSPAESPSG